MGLLLKPLEGLQPRLSGSSGHPRATATGLQKQPWRQKWQRSQRPFPRVPKRAHAMRALWHPGHQAPSAASLAASASQGRQAPAPLYALSAASTAALAPASLQGRGGAGSHAPSLGHSHRVPQRTQSGAHARPALLASTALRAAAKAKERHFIFCALH